MQMISCPNCGKLTGFKRALGFGTFFAVVLTAGLWLLVIPFYPRRCIVCGLSQNSLMFTRNRQALVFLGVLLAVGFIADLLLDKPQPQQAPIVKGPNYNESSKPARTLPESKPLESAPITNSTETAPEVATVPVSTAPENHIFREDGRIYSVALVAEADIAVGAQVLAQGRLARFGYAGMQSRLYAVLDDEQQPDKTLMCAMHEDEGAEVLSLYHVQEAVRVSGEYMGNLPIAGNAPMPIVSNCQVASGGDNVVRPDSSQR